MRNGPGLYGSAAVSAGVCAGPDPPPPPVVYANPALIPIADPQCAWETIVDVVDDYFRIKDETPVRIVGNCTTDGSLTTFPQVSPTIFEPWRHDTVDPDHASRTRCKRCVAGRWFA